MKLPRPITNTEEKEDGTANCCAVLVSRYVRSRVCKSSTAMPRVNTNIGRRTKKTMQAYVSPNYAMRLSSRTRRRRRTVPFASYRCPIEFCRASHFRPRLISIGRNLSIPIVDFAGANQKADEAMEVYYSCCEKKLMQRVLNSFFQSGNYDNVRFAMPTNSNQNKRLLMK